MQDPFEARRSARNQAVDLLDYINAMRPDTDQAIVDGLKAIITTLRDGAE
jgi:hypothetical protein